MIEKDSLEFLKIDLDEFNSMVHLYFDKFPIFISLYFY